MQELFDYIEALEVEKEAPAVVEQTVGQKFIEEFRAEFVTIWPDFQLPDELEATSTYVCPDGVRFNVYLEHYVHLRLRGKGAVEEYVEIRFEDEKGYTLWRRLGESGENNLLQDDYRKWQQSVEDYCCSVQRENDMAAALLQAPECKMAGLRQFYWRGCALTLDIAPLTLGIVVSNYTGEALNFELCAHTTNLLDLFERLDVGLPWREGSYLINTNQTEDHAEYMFTGYAAAHDELPLTAVLFALRKPSEQYNFIRDLTASLRMYYADLYAWADEFAAQFDTTRGKALSALCAF